MRTTPFRTAFLLLPFSIVAAHSAPIQNLTFTEVIKDVFIIDPSTKKETPAKNGDKLLPPNVLKTGADSRAELVAEDKTVTRVGSNTIFSVEANSRDVNLSQGSVLFHSPAGRGGGRIKSAGATASVLGTTLVVSANSDGGFKTSLLEGKGEVKDPKGSKVGLVAGQVTFAKPGGGLSPALNFDLKAQISSSKLVGGFAAPLASLAKIEAAVAVQQAKIAGGQLASTGMLIGDRPDTAFKVDATIVDGQRKLAQTTALAQEAALKESQTFFEVDPRYLDFVLNRVQNLLPPKLTEADLLTGDNNFLIDGTGRTTLETQNGTVIVGVPTQVPKSPTNSTVTLTVDQTVSQTELPDPPISQIIETKTYPTIAPNISLRFENIGTKSTPFGTTAIAPNPNLSAELDPSLPDSRTAKVSSGLVALENIELKGNIDFVNQDNNTATPDGGEISLAFLLSAGRTITIERASIISANAGLFELFTAGTSFSADLQLNKINLKPGESFVGLSLDTVALVQKADAAASTLRITAPQIQLVNTLLLSAVADDRGPSSIAIESAGLISISTTAVESLSEESEKHLSDLLAGLREQNNQQTGLHLGFEGIQDLCLSAFKVQIESKTKTVSLKGVNIRANEITLRGGDTLTLSSISTDPQDFLKEQTITASASNAVTFDSGVIPDPKRPSLLQAAFKSNIYSDNGNVEITNTEFGSFDPMSSPAAGTAARTMFTANALKGAVLLTTSAINADTVLFNGNSVTFKGVYIGPTDSDQGTITVNSKQDMKVTDSKWDAESSSSSRSLTQNKGFKAYKIVLDSKDNMTLTDLTVDHVNYAMANQFNATAVNQLDMAGVDLRYAQKVALDAQTLVLSNVNFGAGTRLTMTSELGALSTPSNRDGITPGWVNVLPNVMYGTYDLNHLSSQMTTFGTEPNGRTPGIPVANFPKVVEAVKAATGTDLSKITIAARPTK